MKNYGFTLLELIITIALAAILLGLAVPSMHTFIQNNRIAGQTNDLIAALTLVRSEALKRNRQAWLCPSQNVDTNAPACGGSDWTRGWLVVAQAPDGSEVVVRAWPDSDIQLDNVTFYGPGAEEIRFQSNGALAGGVNGSSDSDCPDAVCLDLEIDHAGCRDGDDLGFRRIAISTTGGTNITTKSCESTP